MTYFVWILPFAFNSRLTLHSCYKHTEFFKIRNCDFFPNEKYAQKKVGKMTNFRFSNFLQSYSVCCMNCHPSLHIRNHFSKPHEHRESTSSWEEVTSSFQCPGCVFVSERLSRPFLSIHLSDNFIMIKCALLNLFLRPSALLQCFAVKISTKADLASSH